MLKWRANRPATINMTSPPAPDDQSAGDEASFSAFRIVVLGLPLLVLSAIWVQIAEIHRQAGDMSGGVPPAAAWAVFLPVLLFCALIPVLRRRWRVTRGELIVIFSMLTVAVPLFGDGFWRHFVALQHENHRSRYLDMAMSSSPRLWPNYGNVLEDASVENGSVDGVTWKIDTPSPSAVVPAPDSAGRALRIVHDSDSEVSTVTAVIEATGKRPFPLPLTRNAVFARIRLDDPGTSTQVALAAGLQPDRLREIKSLRRKTQAGTLSPGRFEITGGIDYVTPRELEDRFILQLEFKGAGTLYAKDFSIIDTEVVYRYLEGYKDATPEVYAGLPHADRSEVRLRPERGFNLPYMKYMVLGLVPWDAWAVPLAAWSLVVAGTFLAMYCLVTIFYRHWEEGDRLTFPLQNFLLDATDRDEKKGLLLRHSTPFWIAFVLCAVHISLVELHTYYEDVPSFELRLEVADLLPAGPAHDALKGDWAHKPLEVNIRPLYVAVAFFMSVEMSFSLVAFYLLAWVYRFTCAFTPLKTMRLAPESLDTPYPFGFLMAAGGLLFMACFCVGGARKHLVKVMRKAIRGDPAVDDSREALGYRTAVLGLVLAAILYAVFARVADISVLFVLGLLGLYLMLSLSAARIRAETGFPHVGIMITYPQRLLVGVGGVLFFGYSEFVFTGQAMWLYLGSFLLLAPLLAEAMAASTRTGVPLRKLTRCIFAAFLIAMPLGAVVSMSSAYTHGAINMNKMAAEKRHDFGWNIGGGREADELQIGRYFNEHPDEEPLITEENKGSISRGHAPVLIVAGISFAISALIGLARVLWLGFPLHPLGFALSFTTGMAVLWSSIAAGGAIKHLGLRFGGVQLVRRTLRPFCIGLFIGDIVFTVLWTIIEAFTRGAAPPGFSGHSGF